MKIDSSIAAVVTGGASGLGAASARRLAALGAKVAIFDVDDAQGGPLADQIGGVYCRADVTSQGQVEAAFARARSTFGQERVLVNCAGVGDAFKTAARDRQTGKVTPYPLDKFERTIQINLIGTFRCIAMSAAGMLALPPLSDGERGVIVCTASVAAEDGQMGQAAYSAAKAGIVGMTLPIARDLMNEGVRVNTIMPGLFDTPLLQSAPDHVRQSLAASVPFPKRLGAPPEYAALVEALITNGYFNGASLRLDGAIRMPAR